MLLICCEHIRTLSNPVREEVPLKLMWKTSPDTFCRKLVYDSNVSYIVVVFHVAFAKDQKRALYRFESFYWNTVLIYNH